MNTPKNAMELLLGSEYIRVIDAVGEKYGVHETDTALREILTIHLIQLLRVTRGLDGINTFPLRVNPKHFKGKTLTDVACGRADPYPHTPIGIDRCFEPWLSRIGVMLGMKVTGIDQAEQVPMNVQHGGAGTI